MDLSSDFPGAVEISRSNFRVNNKRLVLAYVGHLEKEHYKDWLISRVTKSGCTDNVSLIEVSHEPPVCETGTGLTFAALGLSKTFQTTNAKFFDYVDDSNATHHAKVLKITTDANWKLSIKRLGACDPENDSLKSFGLTKQDEWDSLMNSDTLYDACKQMEPRSVQDVVTMWNIRPYVSMNLTYDHYAWHDHLYDQLDNNKNTRTLKWYYDKVGCTGKSRVGRYLAGTYPTRVRYIRDWSDTSKFSTLICNELSAGWTGEILIVDVPRARKVCVTFYSCMETLMDGAVNTTRYQGRCMVIPILPRVFVFSNTLPNVRCMSTDRWEDVYHIEDKNTKPRKLTVREIVEMRQKDWDAREEVPEGAVTWDSYGTGDGNQHSDIVFSSPYGSV